MKIISWNVNGLRAAYDKGFSELIKTCGADIVCLQEIKAMPDQFPPMPREYTLYANSAEKKGYSGTAILTRTPPRQIRFGMDIDAHDHEGRLITAEYDEFFLVNSYTPNAQDELRRIDYRMQWEDDLFEYLLALREKKPVILCGDLNVAHQEIDIKNASANRGHAGFSDQERACMSRLLSGGFIDSFRYLYPDRVAYTWWSYMFRARERNAGWRLDYFILSEDLKPSLGDSRILSDVMGSDHCPVELSIF